MPDLNADGLPRVYDRQLAEQTYLFVRGDEKRPDKKHPIAPAVPAALGGRLRIEPVKLPPLAAAPDKRDFVIAETVAASKAAAERADASLPALRRTAVVQVAATAFGPPLVRVAQAAGAQRALELLAVDQRGLTETLLLTYGITRGMLANLIRAGLASVQRQRVRAGGRTMEVVRVRITEAGRKATEDSPRVDACPQ